MFDECCLRLLESRLRKSARFGSFAELKHQFAGADKVGKFTVFNISGNHARFTSDKYLPITSMTWENGRNNYVDGNRL